MDAVPWAGVRLLGGILLIVLVHAGLSAAEGQRPRVALVLSGGGARGTAHVGVIRALEDLRIPVDLIIGTSMGSIVGGMYAAGYTADEIEEEFRLADWRTIFTDNPPRPELWFRRRQDDRIFQVDLELGWADGAPKLPPGFIIGTNTEAFLEGLFLDVATVRDFDRLPIPFRCVATDTADGSAVALAGGHLPTAIRASMSLPGIYAPVVIDGRILIDGGVVDNLPIRLAQDLGADIVIAVDIAGKPAAPDSAPSAIAVFGQMVSLLMQTNRQASLAALRDQDILVVPDVTGVGLMDFATAGPAVAAGESATLIHRDRLGVLSTDVATYAAWRAGIRAARDPTRVVRAVTVQGRTGLSEAVLRRHITLARGRTLSTADLLGTRRRLAGLGIFEHIDIDVVAVGGSEADVTIAPVEKSWGPHYFRFGVGVASDLQGNGEFDVGIQHTWTPINRQGGEWRNEVQVGTRGRMFSEFYQPFDSGLRWFVAPAVEYRYDVLPILLNGEPFADFVFDAFGGRLDLGRNLGYVGEVRVGYGRTHGNATPRIAPPGFPRDRIEIDEHDLTATLVVDTLDNVRFPRTGYVGDLEFKASREDLSRGEDERHRLSGGASIPLTAGALTILPSLEGGSVLKGVTSIGGAFDLGGFRRLSGYSPGEIAGDQMALGVLQVHVKLGERTTRFGIAPYVGATFEAGNVWARRSDIDLGDLRYSGAAFLGADTFVGQAYLGFGMAERGKTAIYIYIGPIF